MSTLSITFDWNDVQYRLFDFRPRSRSPGMMPMHIWPTLDFVTIKNNFQMPRSLRHYDLEREASDTLVQHGAGSIPATGQL